MTTVLQADANHEEFGIFVERFMDFMNLWTVYADLLKGHYVPSIPREKEWSRTDIQTTLMFNLCAFFYSLVEDSEDAINAFRIWRIRYPEEESAIVAVEAQVCPMISDLRVFRNRLGFHGSRSRKHEAAGLDFFANHSGDATLAAMKKFKSLGAALLAKDNARQGIQGVDANEVRRRLDSFTQ